MRNKYRRICRHIGISFDIMEDHVHKILNKFRPAIGLLRSFRGTLPAIPPNDVESGRPDLIQSRSQDNTTDATKKAPQLQDTGSWGASQDGPVDSSTANNNLGDDPLENNEPPQRHFTSGASRFVLAKEGSEECVALLVNETFLDKLRDLFQQNRDVDALDGPLCHAEMDVKNIECSVQRAQCSLEAAETQEEAQGYRDLIEKKTSELVKIRHRRDQLEKERSLVKGSLEFSRNHTQWVLETAMREADLLGPEKPLPGILLRHRETEFTEEVEVPEHVMPTQIPAESVATDHEDVEASEEEVQRQEAYDDFMDRSQLLDTVQADFDDRQQTYRENLAQYLQKVEAGTSKMSRSEFDRRSLQYGQQITRALIDAEEAFEQARELALDLGAIGSDYGHEFYYGAEYEESWPENQIAEYNASQDWSFIENWMDNIPDSTSQADLDSVEIDDWDAEEVEVNDSISMIDCEDYRQGIDRYRRICARLEDPCPEVRFLGQPDARPLERRFSFWM